LLLHIHTYIQEGPCSETWEEKEQPKEFLGVIGSFQRARLDQIRKARRKKKYWVFF
jgi:hypothetical protein